MPVPLPYYDPLALVREPAAELSPVGLYLDLIKRCLTRYGFDDDLVPVEPFPGWRRRLWPLIQRGLDRQDWVVHRRAPFNPEYREDGRDWPERAETMIGLRRLNNLQFCMERVIADEIPGDVIECGVWRGGAAIFMRAVLAARGDTSRRVWVADSFQGLPKPDPKHPADRGDEHWTKDALAVSLEEVKRNFSRYNLLDQQVRFLPGWFNETLPTAPIERLSVLRADGDMYGSTTDILTSLYPKLSVGGYAIIDDYGAVPACRAAVEDYRAEHGISEPIERIDWTGVFWQRAG
ncbi:MAG TPA: TylF/MycF family methyltransferase [Acidimicrobiales bacterium]|jgi:O-methyltransferase|nr:TylF/MycF family methyltransferase [Acidimicrobiales bacterium]